MRNYAVRERLKLLLTEVDYELSRLAKNSSNKLQTWDDWLQHNLFYDHHIRNEDGVIIGNNFDHK